MAKPTQTFTWATDPLYTIGPEVGLTTRLAPPGGYAAQGWVPTEEAPARYANHIMGLTGDWINYLAGLSTDADFLDDTFAWTGQHSFLGQTAFGGPTSFHAPVSYFLGATVGFADDVSFGPTSDVHVNGPADFTNTARFDGATTFNSSVVITGLASFNLANSPAVQITPDAVFANDLNVVGTFGTGGDAFIGGELSISDDINLGSAAEVVYDPPRTRVITLPLSSAQIVNSGALFTYSILNDNLTTGSSGTATAVFPVNVPRGANLTRLRAGTINRTGGASTHELAMYVYVHDKSPPGMVSTRNTVTLETASVAAGADKVFDLPISLVVDSSLRSITVVATMGPTSDLQWIEVTYLDPGPRNG